MENIFSHFYLNYAEKGSKLYQKDVLGFPGIQNLIMNIMFTNQIVMIF